MAYKYNSHRGAEQTKTLDRTEDGRRKALKDLTAKLCEKMETTLKEDANIHFVREGVYKANIRVLFPKRSNVNWHDSSSQNQWMMKDVCIVNPLKHAADYYDKYIDLIKEETKVLFVATNSARRPPTGIPFHENYAFEKMFKRIKVDEGYLKWMGSEFVQDSESGEIFWGCMDQYFGSSEEFFRHCFVINYCPLIFTDEERTCNIPLSDLDPYESIVKALVNDCHNALPQVVKILKPNLIVTIGTYAEDRVRYALGDFAANINFRSICQPVAISYQEGNVPTTLKVEKWKRKVDEELEGDYVWRAITKGSGYSSYWQK